MLDIETDFDRHRPIMKCDETSFYKNLVKITDGHVITPNNRKATFFCPGGFNKFEDEEIEATCIEKKIYRVKGEDVDYDKLHCEKEWQLVTLSTSEKCASGDAKIFKIGMYVKGTFHEVYRICFQAALKISLYGQHTMGGCFAGVARKQEKNWSDSDLIDYNIKEIYECGQQKNVLDTISGTSFRDDRCCYALRQLVNERDVAPGLAQISTHSYTNVAPHWNTCSMTVSMRYFSSSVCLCEHGTLFN